MRIEYTLTKKHIWQCQVYHWGNRTRRRLLLFVVLWLLVMGLSFITRVSAGRTTLSVGLALALVGLTVQSAIYVFALLFRFRKSLKSGVCGSFAAEISKLDFWSGKPQSAGYYYHWTDFEDIAIIGDLLYFTLKKKRILIIPKSAFANASEAAMFLETARQHWDAAKTRHRYAASATEGVWPPAPRPGNSVEPGDRPKC
jgi:hypothetical protein